MSETLPEEELNQIDYNMAQIHLARYMIRKKIIKTFEEYTERFAPVLELLADGSIEYAEPDWDKIRTEVKTLTKHI